jgi:cytochrome P450
MVALSIGLMHSSSRLYDQPDEFRPERFLGRPATHDFIPFGGGTHRCLGANFALQEMRAVLSALLRMVDLEPVDPRPEPTKASGPMLVAGRGTQVVLRTRPAGDPAAEPRDLGGVGGSV